MAYWVLKVVLTPVLHLLYRVRVEGRDNVPRQGPVILAGNHVSFCDSIFLPLVLHRRVTFVAKAEYFERRRTAWFFRAVGQIPIRRGEGRASRRALETAKGVLDEGKVFAIYPEGTRSPDGRLYRGHTGVGRLALDSGAPVVAVAMIGTDAVQPIGKVVPRIFRRVTVRFSAPMDFRHLGSRTRDPRALREITDTIMWTLQQLSGQDYLDVYARRRKAVTEQDVADRAPVPSRPPAAIHPASRARTA